MSAQTDTGHWRQVADALVATADRAIDPGARAEKLTEAGDVWRDRLGAKGQASALYARAVDAHPSGADGCLKRLARLARDGAEPAVVDRLVDALCKAGRWGDAVIVLRRRADAERSARVRVDLLLRAADLAENRLGDVTTGRSLTLEAARLAHGDEAERCAERLRRHCAQRPDDADAAGALAQLLARCGRPKEAVARLIGAAARVPELDRKARLLVDAGMLCAQSGGSPIEGIGHLHEARLLDPELASAVQERLDAIEARWGADPEVAEALVKVHERAGQSARVHRLLERLHAAAPSREKGAALLRLAEHAEYQLLEPGRAFALYHQGLEGGLSSPETFCAGMRRVAAEGVDGAYRVMSEAFERLEMYEALAAALQDEASLQSGDPGRARLMHRAGEVFERRLDDVEGAMRCYLEAFKHAPEEPSYLAAGERLYRRRGDWPMVDRLLVLQLAVEDTVEGKCRLLIDSGRVKHQQLHDPVGAYQALRQGLEVASAGGDAGGAGGGDATAVVDRPSVNGVWGALETLVADGDAFEAIEASIRRLAASEDAAGAARRLCELADLYAEFRGEPEHAVQVLQQAADANPNDPALFDRVGSALVQCAAEGRVGVGSSADWLASALDRPLPRAVQLRAADEAAVRFEASAETVAARDVVRRAFMLAPDPTRRARMLDLARSAGDQGALVRCLTEALGAGQAAHTDERSQLRIQLARAHEAMGEPALATDSWRLVLSTQPGHREALAWARGWFAARGEWAALAEALERGVAADPAADALRRELASIAELQLLDPARAARALEPLLAHGAQVEEELARLYGGAGDTAGILRVLGRRLAQAKRPELIRQAASRLLEQTPADGPEAAPARALALARLLELEPDRADLASQRVEALRLSGDLAGLTDALGTLAALDRGPVGRAAFLERAGLLVATRSLPLARQELEDRLEGSPHDDTLLEALATVYGELGEDAARHEILRNRAERLDGAARRKVLAEAALVAELRLGDLTRAAADWRLLLVQLPDDLEALDELARLLEEAQDLAGFVDVGDRLLRNTVGADRVDLARRLARAALELARTDVAERYFGEVLQLAPRDREALSERARLAGEAGRPADAARYWGRLVHADPQAGTQALARQAAALVDAGDLAGAMTAWQAVREAEPESRAPLSQIRELARVLEDWWTLATTLVAELRLVRDPEERMQLDRVLGRISSDELGDTIGAAAAWERVLAVRPQDPEALDALIALNKGLGRKDALEGVLKRQLDGLEGEARTEALARAARSGVSATQAFEWLLEALRSGASPTPNLLSELTELSERIESAGEAPDRARAEALAEALEGARRQVMGVLQEVELLLRQSTLWERRLGDGQRALRCAFDALKLQPRGTVVLMEVERLARAIGDFEALSDALQIAGHAASPPKRGALLAKAAEVNEGPLQAPDRAFELLLQAGHGGFDGAEEALTGLSARHGLWPQYKTAMTRAWRAQADDSSRMAVLAQFAHRLETVANDAEGAFEQWLLAFQIDPFAEAPRANVWRMAEALKAWPIVARVLVLKIDAAGDSPQHAVQCAALWATLAAVEADRLDRPKKAFEAFRRAFGRDPTHRAWHDAAVALADTLGTGRDLAAQWAEDSGWAENLEHRRTLLRAAAALYARVGAPRLAAGLMERLHALGDLDAVADGCDLLREAGAHRELADALQRAAAAPDVPNRTALLRERAALLEGPLDAARQAEDAWRQVLETVPGDREAFEALIGLLEAREAWHALDTVYEAEHQRGAGAQSLAEITARWCELLWSRLGRKREAFDRWLALAEHAPMTRDAVKVLLKRARTIGAESKVAALLEGQEARLPEADHGWLQHQLGRLYADVLEDADRAVAAFEKALDAGVESAGLALAGVLRGAGKDDALAELYLRVGPGLLGAAATVERDSDWALALVELLDRVGRGEQAAEVLDQHLKRWPQCLASHRARFELAVAGQDAARVVLATDGLAALLGPGDDAADVWAEAAAAATALGATERGTRMWWRVVGMRPGDAAALSALERLASKAEDPGLRAAVYEARAFALDGEAAADAWVAAARLRCDEMAWSPRAAELCERALGLVPNHAGALALLIRMAVAAGPAEPAERLERSLSGAEAGSARADAQADLLMDRARRAAERDDDDALCAALEGAVAAAPSRVAPRLQLADRYYARGELAAAAELYQGTPKPSPTDVDAWLKRAECYAMAGLHEAAAKAWDRVSVAPEHSARAMAGRIEALLADERWAAAARALVKLADTQEGSVAALSLAQAGALIFGRLGKTRRSAGLFERAVQGGLEDVDLLETAFEVFTEAGAKRSACAVAERMVSGAANPQRWLRVHAQLLTTLRRPEAGEALWAAFEAGLTAALAAPLAAWLQRPMDKELREVVLDAAYGATKDAPAEEAIALLKVVAEAQVGRSPTGLRAACEAWHVLEPSALRPRTLLAELLDPGAALPHRVALAQAHPGELSFLEAVSDCRVAAGRPPEPALEALRSLLAGEAELSDEPSEPESAPDAFEPIGPLDALLGEPEGEHAGALMSWLFTTFGQAIGDLLHAAHAGDEVEPLEGEFGDEAGRIAAAVGNGVELTGTMAGLDEPALERVCPTQVAIPSRWLRLSRRAATFRLARLLVMADGPAAFADLLPRPEALGLYCAAVAIGRPDEGIEHAERLGVQTDRLLWWIEFLEARLDGEASAALETMSGAVLAEGPEAFERWVRDVERTADRAAFLLSNDWSGVVPGHAWPTRGLDPSAWAPQTRLGNLYRWVFSGAGLDR